MKTAILMLSMMTLPAMAGAKCGPDGAPERGVRLRVISPVTGGKALKNECKVTRLDGGTPIDTLVVKNRKECPAAGIDFVGDLQHQCAGKGASGYVFTIQDAAHYRSHRPEHVIDVQKIAKSIPKAHRHRQAVEEKYFRKKKPTGSTREKTLYCEPVGVLVEVTYAPSEGSLEESRDSVEGKPKVTRGECD